MGAVSAPVFFEENMMKHKRPSVRNLCVCAIVAALYAAITVLTAPFSYGFIQFRLSEALVILCVFSTRLGVGITMGCLLANLFSPVTALDVVVGTFATALACFLTGKCKRLLPALLPNILCNTVLVGGMLAVVLMPDKLPLGFLICGAQVAIGEIAVMTVLGIPLYLFAKRTGFVDRVMDK